jgi:hypothetical protein
MIYKWFKIGNDDFTARDISIQFSIDTANNNFGYAKIIHSGHQTIDITISVDYNQTNSNYFFNLFDKSRQPGNFASDYKFDVSSNEFLARGCIIKSISTDPTTNLIVMDIRSDFSTVKPIQERRDEIIDEILNETSKNKNHIIKK